MLLTFYFIRIYLKDVHPLRKDLQQGHKVYIRIDAETCQLMNKKSTACIVLAPSSQLVLG